ncbi:hypothetical protein BBJ29_010084 [Phytophthora kernoviae]|uniref:Protein kinase domain-containing protein n=1 Tax=Phytophthora kernoviae TaxID=325452 RepID=A0A3F2RAQ1_9STRA|nr:hypothetical protein BBJ29_010084 [Phytophthora kernoviae]RLN50058.1 hypothetical protein BBP00_00010080 [Phytophthora kernoviae]
MLVDRFRLRRRLSNALYGPVGLFEDTHHSDKLVALKQVSLARAVGALRLNPNMDNPWSEHRVITQLMSLPVHPNIVQFRGEFLTAEDTWCVVMEFCDGGDLWDLLEDTPKNRLPECVALDLFRQCVRGVNFLHSHGIAHRDLSLENVFYCRGVCKVGDFGLSTDSPVRASGESVGKPYYMAPEVVSCKGYDAFAADMWSLGIMLFIMLTGSPLISDAGANNKAFGAFCELGVARVIESWGLSPRISKSSVALLDRLLRLNPSERVTASEVVEMLETEDPATQLVAVAANAHLSDKPAMIRQRCRLKDKVADARYGRECVCEDALVHNELVAIKQASLEQASSLLKLHPNADSPWQERRTITKLLMLPLIRT